jgi:uncharacterized protein (DUF2141 family)
MRRVLTIILATLPLLANCQQAKLRVLMVVEKPKLGGTLHVALCHDRDAYNSGEGCINRMVSVQGSTTLCSFDSLAPGTWAVRVFQDINADGRLNTSWLGWPKEPVGFGNDAPVSTGPPFKLAALTLASGENSTRMLVR